MATVFTQDAVLHFLQTSGGSVKNSDLLLHFRNFIRDHADRNRNRELFKKFVNSVATVKQIDSVSYVVLRKKFKGHVLGGGEDGSTEPQQLPAGKITEPSPESARLSPAWREEKPRQRAQQREVTAPAPPGVTAGNTVLPAAGIMRNNNNNNKVVNKVETNLNLKQQQVPSTPDLSGRSAAAQGGSQISQTPSLSEPPAPDQCIKVGQHRVGSGPPAGVTPGIAEVRHHRETRQQVPVPETVRGREVSLQPERGLHQEPPLRQVGLQSERGLRQEPPLHQVGLQSERGLRQEPPLHQVGLHSERGLHQEPPLHQVGLHSERGLHQEPPLRQVGLQSERGLHQEPPLRQVGLHSERGLRQEPPLHQVGLQSERGFRQEAPLHQVGLQPERGLRQEPPLHQVSLQPERGLHQEPPHHVSLQPERGLHQEPPIHHVSLQPEKGVHQEPPLRPVSLQSQGAPRRMRHRKSYKSAVSYDDDDEEEEEEDQVSTGSAGASSASLPCINHPVPPSVVSSSSSSSSERKLPKIYVQDVEGETLAGPGWSLDPRLGPKGQWGGPDPLESTSTRRGPPSQAERYMPSPERAIEVVPHRDVHADRRQPGGVHQEPKQGPSQSQEEWLSSSHSSIFARSSDSGLPSSDWPPSSSSRGSGWNRSLEDLRVRAGEPGGGSTIQEAILRAQRKRLEPEAQHAKTAPWHHSTGHLLDDQEPIARLSPFHHSTEHLRDNHSSTARMAPWHLSTGDLHDDREEGESSDGSTSSPPLRLRPAVARRMSSQLRSRMCRSLGADLDQLLQEEARAAGGSEAARLNRLHMISSSLSLRYNLSSSSLSSCSTPPRSHSFANLVEGVEGRGGRRSSPSATSSTAPQEGPSKQSLVPLEPREHAWLVKGAAGAWPEIYTLFREEPSLLNRQDFISGFTVLHWIAKHGDHRVLNTLWYGVQKAGLTFDTNVKSACGYTPLHVAAIHGHKNIMRLLVNKFGADVKLRDTAGKKPWQYLSRATPPDVFQLLGAPARHALGGEGGVATDEPSWEQRQPHRRRKRHHLSFASSGERPLTIAGTIKVKRSSSIAALLKHKSMRRFHRNQSDSFL